MNKNILIVVIALVIILAIAGIYLLMQPKAVQNAQTNNTPATQENIPSSSSGAVATPKTYKVAIQSFSFIPPELTIKKGDTVVWTNYDSVAHKILAPGIQGNEISNGQSFSFTFDTIGSTDYICAIHTYMKGKIIVK